MESRLKHYYNTNNSQFDIFEGEDSFVSGFKINIFLIMFSIPSRLTIDIFEATR